MRKGQKMPEEQKRKIAQALMGNSNGTSNKGRTYTPETIIKMSFASKGRIVSEATRLKISNSTKGRIGKKHTPESKEKLRLSSLGRKQSPETIEKKRLANTGKKRSLEFCQRLSLFSTGRHASLETRKKQSESRLRYIESGGLQKHMYNTKPELKMKSILDSLGVHYIFQKRIENMIVDFYVPEKNLVIEVDGNYWHNYPIGTEKDRARDTLLKIKGYKIIRFWESDLMGMNTITI